MRGAAASRSVAKASLFVQRSSIATGPARPTYRRCEGADEAAGRVDCFSFESLPCRGVQAYRRGSADALAIFGGGARQALASMQAIVAGGAAALALIDRARQAAEAASLALPRFD